MTERAKRTCIVNPTELDRRRHARGWSMEKLAAKANVSVRTLTRIGQGKDILLSNASAIADALGVNCESLLEHPAKAAVVREKSGFTFSIKTVGELRTREQVQLIATIANDMVKRLAEADIAIEMHEQNLHAILRSNDAAHALVCIDAAPTDPEPAARFYSGGFRNFAYALVPRAEYDRVCSNPSQWVRSDASFPFGRTDWNGMTILSAVYIGDESNKAFINEALSHAFRPIPPPSKPCASLWKTLLSNLNNIGNMLVGRDKRQ